MFEAGHVAEAEGNLASARDHWQKALAADPAGPTGEAARRALGMVDVPLAVTKSPAAPGEGQEVTSFLHSMLRVSDPQATIDFFKLIGLEERRRTDVPAGKFTLIFLGAGDDKAEVELTHNWEEDRL